MIIPFIWPWGQSQVGAQVNADWTAAIGPAQILNKPSIPAAQQSADWNASTGVTRILNKPALFSGAYADLTGKPALFSGAYADLTGKPTIPTVKRTETYTGSTDANGLITVTYPTPFSVVPNVQPGPPPSSDMSWVLVSSTTTGFSLRLVQRAVLTVLSLQVLAGTVTSVAGSPARVLVVES